MTAPGRGAARLVLASGSPRRHELIAHLGRAVEVVVPDVDEELRPGESPRDYVRRVAVDKVHAVPVEGDDTVLVAADTTVDLDGEVLAKPLDPTDAARMLRLLSGRTHLVHTGLAVRQGERVVTEVVTTEVTFRGLDANLIAWYVGTGEPLDKAGAYALQGAGGRLVVRVDGSVSNVIGLPLAELDALLAQVERAPSDAAAGA